MLVLPLGTAQEDTIPDDAVFNGGFEIAVDQARPAICEIFGEGYINLFQPGNPLGLPWLVSINPCHTGAFKAAQWSSGMTTEFGDFDGDGDREAKFLAGSTDPNLGAGHNLWQAYPNTQQAYTAGFASYELSVEGDVPANAAILLSLSTTPITSQTPWVGPFLECSLAFRGDLLTPDESGRIVIDPTYGVLSTRYVDCDGPAAAFNAAAPGSDERREILDGLRIVQNSFWSWNAGESDVVIDDVTMVGSRTAVESLLS